MTDDDFDDVLTELDPPEGIEGAEEAVEGFDSTVWRILYASLAQENYSQ